jgi:hypothetical protein
MHDFGFRWQLSRHLSFFVAARTAYSRRQMLYALALPCFSIGVVITIERFTVTQPTGHQEVELRPQLARKWFSISAAQTQALPGLQITCGLSSLTDRVLMFCASSRISTLHNCGCRTSRSLGSKA